MSCYPNSRSRFNPLDRTKPDIRGIRQRNVVHRMPRARDQTLEFCDKRISCPRAAFQYPTAASFINCFLQHRHRLFPSNWRNFSIDPVKQLLRMYDSTSSSALSIEDLFLMTLYVASFNFHFHPGSASRASTFSSARRFFFLLALKFVTQLPSLYPSKVTKADGGLLCPCSTA